jgi:hypothetical protein
MKKTLMLIGAVILAALIAAGGFWSGMAYQSNRAEQARANFMNARGGTEVGQLPAGGQFPGGGPAFDGGQDAGFAGGRGTTGQVKTVEGNVMTVSTAQDVTIVQLSESIQIQKSVAGTAADLQPGMRVMIAGQKDNDGTVTAGQVTILNNSSQDAAYPPPAGMEP